MIGRRKLSESGLPSGYRIGSCGRTIFTAPCQINTRTLLVPSCTSNTRPSRPSVFVFRSGSSGPFGMLSVIKNAAIKQAPPRIASVNQRFLKVRESKSAQKKIPTSSPSHGPRLPLNHNASNCIAPMKTYTAARTTR